MSQYGNMTFGWRAKLPSESAEWTAIEEMATEDLELYERARQGLSQMLYEEES